MASKTAAVNAVASSATVVTLCEQSGGRKGLVITNDSSAVLYVRYGVAASATDFTLKLAAGERYEMPEQSVYTGKITGIWASANGFARVTQLSG